MTQSSEKIRTFLFSEPDDIYIKPLNDATFAKNSAAIIEKWQKLWQDTIQANSGALIDTLGITKSNYTVAACFDLPEQALNALIAQQKILPTELRALTPYLRTAIYTGPAQAQNSKFFGPTINRLQRLLQMTQPGQTLLGASTQQALAPNSLAASGLILTDLGQHSLRNMVRPENIYQLVVTGLAKSFSNLANATPPNNLPIHTDPLIGRQAEETRLKELLAHPEIQLVTLTGPSGTGKTRLALELGRNLLSSFKDGVFLVNLATVRDPGLLTPTVAQVLGVKEAGSGGEEALLKSLVNHLQNRKVLLILDNFEHLISPPALEWLKYLLANVPSLKVLLTSRQRLNTPFEHEYGVPPLISPTAKTISSAGQLNSYPAVQLFVERARQANPTFDVTDAEAPDVAELVNELEGIPLAIEMTAVKSKLYSARAILNQLSSYLDEVKVKQEAENPTGGQHNRALSGTLSWSFNLLEADEKRVFTRLSVFAGGCTAEAAAAICNYKGDLRLDLVERIEMLMGKGFVQRTPKRSNEQRYTLLETIRQYGLGLLADYGEEAAVMQEYAAYYLKLARTGAEELLGDEQAQWLKKLEQEHDNFRAALDWLLQTNRPVQHVEMALQLAYALWQFWSMRGYLSEGRKWLERALTEALQRGNSLIADEVRARALKAIGTLSNQQADYSAARRYYEQSLAISRQLGDKAGVASLLNNLGVSANEQGDYSAARRLYEESLAQFRELKNQRAMAILLNNLGVTARDQQDFGSARQYLEESLELARQQEDQAALALCLSTLANVALDQQDYLAARNYLDESLRINNDQRLLPFILEYYSGLAAALKQPNLALRLAGSASQIRENIEAPLPPAEEKVLERRLVSARQALGHGANDVWQAGRSLTVEESVRLAQTVNRA